MHRLLIRPDSAIVVRPCYSCRVHTHEGDTLPYGLNFTFYRNALHYTDMVVGFNLNYPELTLLNHVSAMYSELINSICVHQYNITLASEQWSDSVRKCCWIIGSLIEGLWRRALTRRSTCSQKELEAAEKRVKELQDDLAAVQFTPHSKHGSFWWRSVARYRKRTLK